MLIIRFIHKFIIVIYVLPNHANCCKICTVIQKQSLTSFQSRKRTSGNKYFYPYYREQNQINYANTYTDIKMCAIYMHIYKQCTNIYSIYHILFLMYSIERHLLLQLQVRTQCCDHLLVCINWKALLQSLHLIMTTTVDHNFKWSHRREI